MVHTQDQLKRARQSLIAKGRDEADIKGNEVHDEVDRMLAAVPPASPPKGKGAAPPPKAPAPKAAAKGAAPPPAAPKGVAPPPTAVAPTINVSKSSKRGGDGTGVKPPKKAATVAPPPVVEVEEEEEGVGEDDAVVTVEVSTVAPTVAAPTTTFIVKSAGGMAGRIIESIRQHFFGHSTSPPALAFTRRECAGS